MKGKGASLLSVCLPAFGAASRQRRYPGTPTPAAAEILSQKHRNALPEAQKCSYSSAEMLLQQLGPAHDTQPCHCPITPSPRDLLPLSFAFSDIKW